MHCCRNSQSHFRINTEIVITCCDGPFRRVVLKDDGTARAPSGCNYGDGQASHRLSCHVDNGMGNDGTEDGTAWADVQAIQLLLSTCFLCGWDASLTVLGRCHMAK